MGVFHDFGAKSRKVTHICLEQELVVTSASTVHQQEELVGAMIPSSIRTNGSS